MPIDIYSFPVTWLANHPILDRVSLVAESAGLLTEYHHGDPERRERASDLRDDWAAWVQEIRDHGVLEPLKVVKNPDHEGRYLVIDGRHRLQAARDAGKKEVPCVIVHEGDIHAHMEGSVIARRHWTKSMLAYFALLLHPEVAVENRHGGDRKAIKSQKMRLDLTTREELAERYRVSPRLMDDAIWIYRQLDEHPDLRPRIEPSLWAGVPLMRLRLGIEGATATLDQPRRPASPDSASWGKYVNGLRTRLVLWESWTEEQRIRFAGDWRRLVTDLPDDAREVMRAALQADSPESEDDGPIVIDPFHAGDDPTPVNHDNDATAAHGAQGEPETGLCNLYETGGSGIPSPEPTPFATGTERHLSETPQVLAAPSQVSSLASVPVGTPVPDTLTCDRCGRHGFTPSGLARHQALCAPSTSRPVSA